MAELPVGRRAICIVAAQRLLVVRALVAEHGAIALQLWRVVADKAVPVVMAQLVAEMAEQGAVILAELRAHLLALRRIRLGDVERDQAIVMAGQDMLAAWPLTRHVGQEIEGDADLFGKGRLSARRKVRKPVANRRRASLQPRPGSSACGCPR